MPEIVKPHTFACIGECMVEFVETEKNSGHYKRRFGGDTLNTAIYLTRLMGRNGHVHYVTRLGRDSFSNVMIAAWRDENIDCSLVDQYEGRVPGLYMVETDEHGERSFLYWRGEAPAREMFCGNCEPLLDKLNGFDTIYFSGITLAILSQEGRTNLLRLIERRTKAGKATAYDPNFRRALWKDEKEAALWNVRAIANCTLVLPSVEDLQNIFGEQHNANGWIAKLVSLGAKDIVLKNGGRNVFTLVNKQREDFDLNPATLVIDTTGAGDSFNAGYLASRVLGDSVAKSVANGHDLAARVIQHPGAIMPAMAMP
ncbi:MAG TPA: sugar kinase [Aestuariivirga sp.]|jgi:2-dehydro-3-deoxygluconokinase